MRCVRSAQTSFHSSNEERQNDRVVSEDPPDSGYEEFLYPGSLWSCTSFNVNMDTSETRRASASTQNRKTIIQRLAGVSTHSRAERGPSSRAA